MRYIGAVNEEIKETNLSHLKILLEKEAIIRCAKHIINESIRDAPETYVSSIVSYLLNCILAPFPFLDLMNEGKIVFQDQTI
jgi:hypothetical protein